MYGLKGPSLPVFFPVQVFFLYHSFTPLIYVCSLFTPKLLWAVSFSFLSTFSKMQFSFVTYLFISYVFTSFNVPFSLRLMCLPILHYRSYCYRKNWISYGTCSIFNLVVPNFPSVGLTHDFSSHRDTEEIAYYCSVYIFIPLHILFLWRRLWTIIHGFTEYKDLNAFDKLSLLKFQRPPDISRVASF